MIAVRPPTSPEKAGSIKTAGRPEASDNSATNSNGIECTSNELINNIPEADTLSITKTIKKIKINKNASSEP
ncbi:MAG: hypothetical protein GY861_00260 [bacterium]|nr:hypothetical protein [bacterium]